MRPLFSLASNKKNRVKRYVDFVKQGLPGTEKKLIQAEDEMPKDRTITVAGFIFSGRIPGIHASFKV